jgi:hypothetical protein
VDDLRCWHGTAETLARVTRRDDGLLDVVLPVGLAGATTAPHLVVELGGERVPVTPVDRASIASDRKTAKDHPSQLDYARVVRETLEIEQRLDDRSDRRYFTASSTGVTPGPTTLRITAHPSSGPTVVREFPLYLAEPAWTKHDLWHTQRPYDLPDEHWYQHWWALMVQPGADVDHIRLDLVDTVRYDAEDLLPDVLLEFEDAQGSRRTSDDLGHLPLIDRNRDSLVFSVPRRDHAPLARVRVTVRTPANTTTSEWVGRSSGVAATRFMIFNYAIQGLNDLFSAPLLSKGVPTTYAQVTAQDAAGVYSSRPARPETGEPDGYAYTLDAHHRLGVKSHWAFNAGILHLLAADCGGPGGFLEELRECVAEGIISASNAGYGAHRPHYYHLQTNIQEIRLGWEVIERVLGTRGDDVYYPDQRLYNSTPHERDAYTATGVRYLVLDRSTACTRNDDGTQRRLFPSDGDRRPGNQLLRDELSGQNVLLIEDEVREQFLFANDDEVARGKMPRDLRRLFLDHTSPAEGGERRPLLVYGDDVDKASGNGWFDGDPTQGADGQPLTSQKYLAALLWLSEHPWVDVVTTADLDGPAGPGTPPTVRISSATCPSVDPGGAESVEEFGAHNALHFDSWHARWAAHRSPWLGKTLGEIDAEVQDRLVRRTPLAGTAELAWTYYLMNGHESFWNKEPLEFGERNEKDGVLDPEDFVIAESLQLRNTWVFLHAARWAAWAEQNPGSPTRVNSGPVVDAVGLHWDRDLMENVVVHNSEVLLVGDRNGGRITHVFTRRGAEAVALSGTHKAYQFHVPAHGTEPERVCDGDVLQNTVYTPNHRYVASDVTRSLWRPGLHEDVRRPEPRPWLFPDNFNEYATTTTPSSVAFTCQDVGNTWPPELNDEVFLRACEQDRIARTTGAEPRVIWRDRGPEFTKTITLDGNRIGVTYTGTATGHLVSNEFCLDLRSQAMARGTQSREDLGTTGAVLTGPRGTTVTVRADGCALVPDDPRDPLSRVLTDDVRLRANSAGGFRYTITVG